MNVELIVDSTVDVPEHIRSRLTVVPLTIHFGQEEYLDGVTMDKHRFYERLVESDVLPPPSQASPAAFDREFRRVRCSGGSDTVCYDGDVNGSGVTEINDAQRIYSISCGQQRFETKNAEAWLKADLNGDGRITAEDASEILRLI